MIEYCHVILKYFSNHDFFKLQRKLRTFANIFILKKLEFLSLVVDVLIAFGTSFDVQAKVALERTSRNEHPPLPPIEERDAYFRQHYK
jgi:hypothetical protein